MQSEDMEGGMENKLKKKKIHLFTAHQVISYGNPGEGAPKRLEPGNAGRRHSPPDEVRREGSSEECVISFFDLLHLHHKDVSSSTHGRIPPLCYS